ncbi:hypothetical protein TNCT_337151 [Trichonephila clavata]|uniref:Uncharacterized protein n=1 Tax=Trichonephila clavata TaxID=2740835 RepID=A0A8X6GWD4_TRICU|nr:hypothetical protein TNCT_337151 [Trichonephila clavata]
MKRMANPPNMSAKRVCFNKDAKLDSSFSDNAVPPHHFHLGQDIYAAVTYFVLPLCKFIYDNMEEMKTIGFTQLKKVSVCHLCSGNPLQIESS